MNDTAANKAKWIFFFFNGRINKIANKNNRNNTKQGKKYFTKQFDAKSHSIIFYKINKKPIGNTNVLTQEKVCFYPYFQGLICKKNQENNQY